MYRLPVNIDFIIHALADETPSVVYYLDLEMGGVFSVVQPGDVNSVSEDLDHSVVCNLTGFPERFVTLCWPSYVEKTTLIHEFIATLPRSYFEYQFRQASAGWTTFAKVEAALASFPEEGSHWREFLSGKLRELALEILADNDVEAELPAEGGVPLTPPGVRGGARAEASYVPDNQFLKEDRIYGCRSGEFSLMEMAAQVDAVSSLPALAEFVGRLLVNRESNSYRYAGYPAWPFLDAVAWCLDELGDYLGGRGEQIPESPDWRLFGQILFAALYRDTPAFKAWQNAGSDRARLLPGLFSPGG